MPLPTPAVEGPIGRALERELRSIERLLDDMGLTNLRERLPSHPAVKRYDCIRGFIDHKFYVSATDEKDVVIQVGSTLLDNLGLATPIEDTINSIDDKEVLQQLRSRVSDPDQFNDQMAAFSCWQLLNNTRISARLVEKHGLPDICVTLTDAKEEWIEVKRIHIGTDPGRARRVIQKANQQIKRVDANGVGAMFLSIDRHQIERGYSDRIPQDVEPYVKEVERELGSDSSKSVHSVIVAWDDYVVLDHIPGKKGWYLRRRSLAVHHHAPRQKSMLPAEAFEIGRTIGLRGRPSNPP